MNYLVNSPLPKTILIVDDTPDNLNLIFKSLKDCGYKVLIAQSGKKAIKTALAVHPDLILLDVMMLELDGFATCRHLKTNNRTKDIPIIFMTALTETANKLQGFSLGAVDYITKPIDREELLARIQTHLCLKSLQQRSVKDAAQQKLLFETSDRIRQSLDLQSILETATREIRTFLNCDLVWLAVLNNNNISIKAYSAAEGLNFQLTRWPLLSPFEDKSRKDEILSHEDGTNGDSLEKVFPIRGQTSSGSLGNSEETIPYNCFCPNPEDHQFYLQGNIRVIEKGGTETSHKTIALPEPEARLIAPILINSTQATDSGKVQIPIALEEKADKVSRDFSNPDFEQTLPSSLVNNNNSLWGWLIADQYKVPRQWQEEEIELLKGLTTQLAIGIKQGLLYQQLFQLTLLDSLTQVYNRRYFDQQLNLEWRRLQRVPSPLSLIMCDVDCFKIYNDTYGHQQGDECLQRVANAIATVIKRPGDVLARYGGEEFTVILPHTHQSGAIKVAEAIRLAVKELKIPHLNSLVDSVVTMSLGIASTVPNPEDNPYLLVEAADLALYQAKELGRDCLTVYPNPISQAKTQQELKIRWVKRLRQALKENLFSLYAQPIAPLGIDDEKKYFEILLRLTDEGDQVIAPDVFLEIANSNFLMPDIDTWVINNLLETLATSGDGSCWQNYRFAINLSGASLNSESFLKFLSQKLTDYHLPPHLFCFEITESLAISNLAKVAKFIDFLRNLGCSVALDDFGKGMSSLTYLKNLPVDYLKIDGSFIKELNNNKTSKVMVEAINHIAEGIGLKTVAEFVENQNILDSVRDLKIDYGQGFHLGRPGLLRDVITMG